MRCSWLKSGVVYAQKFCRLGVTTLPLVYGDQVEYLVVLPAMHGHADADGHVGKWSKSKCRLCVTIWVKRPSRSAMYLVYEISCESGPALPGISYMFSEHAHALPGVIQGQDPPYKCCYR